MFYVVRPFHLGTYLYKFVELQEDNEPIEMGGKAKTDPMICVSIQLFAPLLPRINMLNISHKPSSQPFHFSKNRTYKISRSIFNTEIFSHELFAF